MKDETHDRPAADRPDAEDRYYFEHERLDCYQLATEVAVWLGKHLPEDRDLRQQARRASHSIVLNIAEGCGRKGRSRKHHYSIARGSAAELSAAFDLMPTDTAAQQRKLRRIGMMLWVMTR